MAQRSELHKLLVAIMTDLFGESAEYQVYFQPPETVKMTYPCIVYERSSADTQFADNRPYIYKVRYTITVIDRNPDSLIPERVARLPMCIYDRNFTSENLHHDVFKIYF